MAAWTVPRVIARISTASSAARSGGATAGRIPERAAGWPLNIVAAACLDPGNLPGTGFKAGRSSMGGRFSVTGAGHVCVPGPTGGSCAARMGVVAVMALALSFRCLRTDFSDAVSAPAGGSDAFGSVQDLPRQEHVRTQADEGVVGLVPAWPVEGNIHVGSVRSEVLFRYVP